MYFSVRTVDFFSKKCLLTKIGIDSPNRRVLTKNRVYLILGASIYFSRKQASSLESPYKNLITANSGNKIRHQLKYITYIVALFTNKLTLKHFLTPNQILREKFSKKPKALPKALRKTLCMLNKRIYFSISILPGYIFAKYNSLNSCMNIQNRILMRK